MAGDLEDFLRRAAQRRQANAGGQPAAPRPAAPQKPQRPQYSNSRTERISRDVEDEIYVAEVVEEKPSPWQERQRKIEEAKRAAKEAESVAALALAKVKASNRSAAPPAPEVKMTGDVAGDLLRLLQSPEGIQQAVLLREILERPVDRW
ncbi:hypothetical protein Pla52o_36520 [Novipirellula galeiformis]|uniref:Uncharacterized protein n=1 Tax=Novipirellula galeiformis TaxID=2528004 RepID=A0A5C6CDM5_9BACT|nr:hypothetical protein [Novipirellula galeiformis]TWU21466.1 hypothetical protein Pla52o_36520 [Novipirellula galeiformis]